MTMRVQERSAELRGIDIGREQGIDIGVDKNRIESIKALMENMNMTLEQAILILKYPMADKEKFAAALQ